MPPQEAQRRLTMTIGGDAFARGHVPLTLLASKLQALQNLLFHAAATVRHDRAARRGQWVNRYRDAVELRFVDARQGSLVIEADLDSASGEALAPHFDLGLQALDLSYQVLDALAQQNAAQANDRLTQLVPDRQERAMLLRSVENLAPDAAEEYYVELSNGAAQHRPVRLSGTTRLTARLLTLRESLASAEPEREATVVGTLTKIHYDVAPQKIAVRVAAGTEIDCYYDESLRDQIANLCAGSIVEVVGIASLDAEGRLKQIDSITGVEPVSMEPIRLSQLEHQGTHYRLREPLPVAIEYTDGTWIYSSPALGLWGYADRREDAVRELAEALDYAYREIAKERDEALDAKAVELKRRLLAAVGAAQPAGG